MLGVHLQPPQRPDIEIELFMRKPRRGWNGASLDRDASDDDRARPAGTDSSAGPQPPAGTWRARPAPARAAQTVPGAYRGRPPGVRRWRRRGTRPEHHCRLAAWSPSFARFGRVAASTRPYNTWSAATAW